MSGVPAYLTGIHAMREVLSGRSDRPMVKADDADALAVKDPEGGQAVCSVCGLRGSPGEVTRHEIRTGHDEPRPDDNAGYVTGDEGLAKSAGGSRVVATDPKKRLTVIGVHPDDFGTDPQTFQERMWKALKPNTLLQVRNDEGHLLGEVRELAQWAWPLPKQAGGLLPADSYYFGVVWKSGPWADIQAGHRSAPDELLAALS